MIRYGKRTTPAYAGDVVRIVETRAIADGRAFFITESLSDGHTAILSEDQMQFLPASYNPPRQPRTN